MRVWGHSEIWSSLRHLEVLVDASCEAGRLLSDTCLKNVGFYEHRCVAGLVHEIWKTDKCLLSISFLLLTFKVLNM